MNTDVSGLMGDHPEKVAARVTKDKERFDTDPEFRAARIVLVALNMVRDEVTARKGGGPEQKGGCSVPYLHKIVHWALDRHAELTAPPATPDKG